MGNYVLVLPSGVALDIVLSDDLKTAIITAPSGYAWTVELNDTLEGIVDVSLIESIVSAIAMRACAYGEGQATLQQYVDPSVPINASGITGASTLVHTQSSGGTYQIDYATVVRHNQYLYMSKGSGTQGQVVEYDIDASTSKTITFGPTITNNYGQGVLIVWLEERIIACMDQREVGATDYSHIYTIDFATDTVTQVWEQHYCPEGWDEIYLNYIAGYVDSTLDIHILGIGYIQRYTEADGAHGWGNFFVDKNYTDDSAWAWTELDASNEEGGDNHAWAGSQEAYDMVNNHYVLAYNCIQYEDPNNIYMHDAAPGVFVYNILTRNLSYTSIAFGHWNWPVFPWFHGSDHTYELAYFWSYGYEEGYDTHLWELDPSDSSYSSIANPASSVWWLVFESRDHAYAYQPSSNTLYRCHDMATMGTFAIPYVNYVKQNNICNVIDDGNGTSGPLLWGLDGTAIKAWTLNGALTVNKSTGITLHNHHAVAHLGDYMMVLTDNDTTSPKHIDFYLIK